MNTTWVKLYRKFSDWEWSNNPFMVSLFIHLLIRANYEPKEWHGQIIERGQLATGLISLNKITGISIQTIRTSLARLESTGEITNRSTNKNRIITIVKFEQYQPNEEKSTNNQQATNKQLTNKHISNQQTTNKQLISKSTRNQQAINKQLTSNQQTSAQVIDEQLTTTKELKKERSKETYTAPPSASRSEKTKKPNDDDTPMILNQFVKWCAKSTQDHIKVIGEWADTVKPDCRTKGQWNAYIKRNLRAARQVSEFTREQQETAYSKIEKARSESKTNFLEHFTLETLLKYMTA